MRHLIDIVDLNENEINSLIRIANDIIDRPALYAHCMEGKKLASLFFESSTRTRLSFEAAMYELGGHVLGFSDAETSSISKGESLQDTIRVVSGYADIIAMRHPKDGAALAAALASDIPVINAGDGSHNHPTQTLTDLLTIQREKGRLNGMTVGVCGDLRYGRTVHSLIGALARYSNMKFILIAPEELRIPDYVLELLDQSGHSYVQTDDLDAAMGELDILYMTRIQRERFQNPEEYEKLKDSYVLTSERMRAARKDMSVLHPLPRVNEISTDVDADPRAAYFRQARNGKYIRMALILKLLEDSQKQGNLLPADVIRADRRLCRNARCIMNAETGLKQYVRNGAVPKCLYCDCRV